MKIKITDITIDQRYQTRTTGIEARECDKHIEDIATAIKSGVEIPAITVHKLPNGQLILTDGFHRTEAHKQTGVVEIEADVVAVDSEEEAWVASFGANDKAAKSGKWGRKPSPAERRASLALHLERPETLVKFGRAERFDVDGYIWYKIDRKKVREALGLTDSDISRDGEHKAILAGWDHTRDEVIRARLQKGESELSIAELTGVSRTVVKKLKPQDTENNVTQTLPQVDFGHADIQPHESYGVDYLWKTLSNMKTQRSNLGRELLETLDHQGKKAELIEYLIKALEYMESNADKVPENRIGVLQERWQ